MSLNFYILEFFSFIILLFSRSYNAFFNFPYSEFKFFFLIRRTLFNFIYKKTIFRICLSFSNKYLRVYLDSLTIISHTVNYSNILGQKNSILIILSASVNDKPGLEYCLELLEFPSSSIHFPT